MTPVRAPDGEVRRVDSVPDAFAELVLDSLAGPGAGPRDGCSIFLSGGPTAERCYRRLAAGAGSADWSVVDAYMGDERCVPPDHPDSNHRMVAEVLLDHVGPVRSDHPMYVSGPPDAAAADYQGQLRSLDRFDLVHLGLGPDGHCASLFAGSAALAVGDPAVLVVADRDPQEANPHDRITLTLPAIARARLVVFTVSGSSKRPAFEGVMGGRDLPAARVRAERIVWLVDAEAGGPSGSPSGSLSGGPSGSPR